VPWYCLPHYVDQANQKAGVLLVTRLYLENDGHPEVFSGVFKLLLILDRKSIIK